MSSLPEAERDACDVQQALAGLAALLSRLPIDADAAGQPDPGLDDVRRVLQRLAEDGGVAAQRVVAYLRTLQGSGDGAAVAVPMRLGPFRDWVPSRGHLFGGVGTARRFDELPQPRRCDPGE
ncbi:MAG TPA: hypothetical protein VFR35_20140 [Actinoplanes sp.]|nr:hypothetical protein [Actinoplanes sp.]